MYIVLPVLSKIIFVIVLPVKDCMYVVLPVLLSKIIFVIVLPVKDCMLLFCLCCQRLYFKDYIVLPVLLTITPKRDTGSNSEKIDEKSDFTLA